MTDKEIIKALECCTTPHTEVKCYCCKSMNDDICNKLNPTIILDLIRRQQAELEKVREEQTEKIGRKKPELCEKKGIYGRLISYSICPSCGERMNIFAKSCYKCGQELDWIDQLY